MRFSRADIRLRLASRMPSQAPLRIAKFGVAAVAPACPAQQSGGSDERNGRLVEARTAG
jgi:hypothetical protein